MQVNCDWSVAGTPAYLEALLEGFKFMGPGLYLSTCDTLLVAHEGEDRWRVYVYNAPIHYTVFGCEHKVCHDAR